MSKGNYDKLQEMARTEFTKYYDRVLDMTFGKEIWVGQPVYVHEHVETTWRGFRDAYIMLKTRPHIEDEAGSLVMSAQVNDND